MNQQQFEQAHQDKWQRFEQRLKEKKPENTNGFPHEYRQICQHLALAKDRQFSPNLVDHLNQLVMQGHQQLYRRRGGGLAAVIQFITRDFPALVRQESRLFWICSLLFYGPFIGIAVAIQFAPEMAYTVISPEQVVQMESMYDPAERVLGPERDADSNFLMFGFYIKNNIGIAFRTFAGGLLFGLGTLFFLLFNGLFIGAVTGQLIYAGLSETFFSFTSGHSAFELTAIVLAGVAGLKLGFALLKPGRKTRGEALRDAARISVRLVYGITIMLTIAAFLEAFWSSNNQFAPMLKYGVGISLWIVLGLYFWRAGRGHEA